MKHYGDITKINGAEVEPVWVLVGGSPCQDLSVAGKRAGLQGARSGLFMEQIRIIKEMREHDKSNGRIGKNIRCRWMVWENVPGALSSGTPKGEDFRIVLEETCKIADPDAVIPEPPKGKWQPSGCIVGDGIDGQYSVAWRIHDAQFWGKTVTDPCGRVVKAGTPQRRRRISLVADFGGLSAPEILFECQGLSGDIEPSREKGQGTSPDAERSSDSTGKCLNSWDVQSKHIQPEDGIAEALYSGECRGGGGESYVMQEHTTDSAYTLKIRGGKEVDSNGRKAGKGALIQEELSGTLGVSQDQTLICYGICSDSSNSMKSDNPNSGIYEAETSKTLDLTGGNPACNQGGMAVVQGADTYSGVMTGEVSATLTSACGSSTGTGPKVITSEEDRLICIEGNGARESHKGDGYKESQTMYTLNTTEQHAVAYRKTAHPMNAEEGQGWEEAKVNDTLNNSDITEARTPTLVVENNGIRKHHRRGNK